MDLTRSLRSFVSSEEGATALEYGLIVMCIFLAIVTAVSAFATAATSMFTTIATAVGSSN